MPCSCLVCRGEEQQECKFRSIRGIEECWVSKKEKRAPRTRQQQETNQENWELFQQCQPGLERLLGTTENLSVKYLKIKLRLYGQPVSGRKHVLAKRLLEFLKNSSDSHAIQETTTLACAHIRDDGDLDVMIESDESDDEEDE